VQLTRRISLALVALAIGATGVTGASCARRASVSTHRGAISLHGAYYVDDDHTMVGTGAIRANVPITDRVSVHGNYGLDIISSASVDVVATASRVFEARHAFGGGFAGSPDSRTTLQARYRGSREPDYRSDGLTLAVDRETEDRMRSFRAEVRARYDLVGPGFVFARAEPLGVVTASVSITQVLDRLTLLRVAAQTDVQAGAMTSPYRYVFLAGAAYPEHVPSVRVRQAALVRVQRSLVPTLSVWGEYDLTLDSWGVQVHTGEVAAQWEIARWLRIDARARWTVQGAASFYRSAYDQLTDYRTRDRSLGDVLTFWPRVGIRINLPGWPSERTWEVGAAAAMLHQTFPGFRPLDQRTAAVLEAWVERLF